MKIKTYLFKVTGGFDINRKFKEELSCISKVVGFKLPDGRTARPIIGLEIESKDGNKFEYVTSESKMSELGFEGLDYGHVFFEEVE